MELKKLELSNPIALEGREIFPRPDLIRTPSYLLDGEWFLCPDRRGIGIKREWYNQDVAERIISKEFYALPHKDAPFTVIVPYSLESDINKKYLCWANYNSEKISKTKRFWYFKMFEKSDDLNAGIIRFGAVDYKTSVWLNGQFLGEHVGGYTPFSFVARFEDINFLVVLVEDSISPSQVRGKQMFFLKPFRAGHIDCSGIWQSVWIEPISRIHIKKISCKRDEKGKQIFSLIIKGLEDIFTGDVRVNLKIFASQVFNKKGLLKTPIKEVNEYTSMDALGNGSLEFVVHDKIFDRWSPDWPAIHPIEVTLKSGRKEYDKIHLLFGHRKIEINDGKIKLNRKNLYQKLLLNKGFYPHGHYTPQDQNQYRLDIELMKRSGFNGCRIYQKIENPLFLFWADILGFLIWEEMPSYYMPSKKNMMEMELQLHEVMVRDSFHPSIITFVLFNESSGIYNMFSSKTAREEVMDLFIRFKNSWPGYFVIDNSGFHHLLTDIADIHHYIPTFKETEEFYSILSRGVREAPFWINYLNLLLRRNNVQTPYMKGYGEKESPLLISEFGNYESGFNNHHDLTIEEYFRRHIELVMKFRDIQGFCYSHFADTSMDNNGLFTINRLPKTNNIKKIIKESASRIYFDNVNKKYSR